MIRRVRPGEDSGETLIEILVAVIVLGIGGVGLVAALSTSVVASDSHRRLSSAETVARGYGELIKNRVLHPATTQLTADVPAFSNGQAVSFHVKSVADFTESLPYTVSLDGDVVNVTAINKTNPTDPVMTGTAKGASLGAGTGALVQRYVSCPDSTYFDGITATHSELTSDPALQTPTITSITFYDANNTQVSDCSSYFKSAGTSSCSNGTDHRAECDPPWMRVSIRVDENTAVRRTCAHSAATATNVCAATDVIIRRIR